MMSSYWMLGLGAGALLIVLVIRRRARARRAAAKNKKAPQKTPPAIDSKPPGKGAPLFHGVKVVELATVVAAPTASRALAEMGAEVVKIEEPGGDPWRKWFLQYESGRPYGTSFESANLAKSSVVLDLKTKDGLSKLKSLLADADVFITNVRRAGLDRLGLAYRDLCDEFPHLIYCHLSAYGREGPGATLPGYDVGAFWANTGLAAMVHEPGRYSGYPVAFGDLSTGYNLMAGVSMALRSRLDTGHGCLLSTALLRTGYWCMAPYLVNERPSTAPRIPNYDRQARERDTLNPLVRCYRLANESWLCLAWVPSTVATNGGDWPERAPVLARELASVTALQDTDHAVEGVASAARSSNGAEAERHLAALFAKVNQSQAEAACRAAAVPQVPMRPLDEVVKADFNADPLTKHAQCVQQVPELTDMPHFVHQPFDLDCSTKHAVDRRAPLAGEHTDHYVTNGFGPVHPQAVIKRTEAASALPLADARRQPGYMTGVVVVELCAYGQCPAAVSVQLADCGATVYKIEDPATNGCLWRQHDPKLFAQLNRGKHSVAADPAKAKDKAVVESLLERANLFVTNWPESQLRAIGLDADSVRARFPALVYTHVTPWGRGAPDLEMADHAPYWAYSGLAGYLCSRGTEPGQFPNQPRQLGELQASLQCLAGVTAALFHQRRTGEGQLVDFNMVRSGLLGISQVYGLMLKDLSKLNLFVVRAEERRDYFPVPTANCYQTKDGAWIQMLGAALPLWLPKFIKAFGLWSLVPKLVWTGITEVALGSKDKSFFQKILPVFKLLNVTFTEFVRTKTLAEFTELCDRKGLWYTFVNMPAQALDYDQAHITGCVQNVDGQIFITSPLHFHAQFSKPSFKVPQLGENNL